MNVTNLGETKVMRTKAGIVEYNVEMIKYEKFTQTNCPQLTR